MIIRRQQAVEGYSEGDSIRYPLPEGSTMSYVVEGHVGPEKCPMHSHEQEEYWYIIEGQAKAIIGDEEVEVFAGDLVIIPANVPHLLWSEKGMRELAFMIQTGKPDERAMQVESQRKK